MPTESASTHTIPGFCRTDWLTFWVTTVLVLLVYLATLAPQVTLGFSGIFSVSAMYLGVAHPPGYPLATLYEWLFVTLLPFGNIAWRVAVSSAVAGAVACGLIGLMVSRAGGTLNNEKPSLPKEAFWLRVISGYAAGMVFGVNGAFWNRAVVADVWTLSVLLFCIVVCLLMRWTFNPERKGYLYWAFFVYGLSITNSQMLLAAAPAFPVIALLRDRHLGRDMFFGYSIVFALGALMVVMRVPLFVGPLSYLSSTSVILLLVYGAISTTTAFVLAIAMKRFFTTWKTVTVCGVLFALGLMPYLLVPIFSMTNPPINWGYPRTVDGSFHVITRGQYCQIKPPTDVLIFLKQVRTYGKITAKEFGWPYLLIAVVPFAFLRRIPAHERRWMLALLVMYVCLTLLTLAVLNPVEARETWSGIKVFFSLSYAMLAVWLG
ncbi:MAG TPA: DUF2723 domain-containing protein, partial [Candidatus Binatia bacterium]|nr:DUF2723 domain-containing protein [Candidatus Binatia bacterium]